MPGPQVKKTVQFASANEADTYGVEKLTGLAKMVDAVQGVVWDSVSLEYVVDSQIFPHLLSGCEQLVIASVARANCESSRFKEVESANVIDMLATVALVATSLNLSLQVSDHIRVLDEESSVDTRWSGPKINLTRRGFDALLELLSNDAASLLAILAPQSPKLAAISSLLTASGEFLTTWLSEVNADRGVTLELIFWIVPHIYFNEKI